MSDSDDLLIFLLFMIPIIIFIVFLAPTEQLDAKRRDCSAQGGQLVYTQRKELICVQELK